MGNKTPRTQITATLLAFLTFALLALPLGASAAGLGKVTVLSALGQPLRAEVDITASREELASLSARVPSPNAFKQAGIEYSQALAGVRISVDKRPDGRPFLSLVSDRPFNEPFLDLLVELDWTSGRLVREYTFLLDPPGLFKKPAASMVAAVPEVKREAPVAVAPDAPAPPVAAKQPDMPVAAPTAPSAPAPSAPSVPPVASAIPPDEQPTRPETKAVHGAGGKQRKPEPAQEKLPREAATRLVKQGDTLSGIAIETRPAGVSLDQMLVALFVGNREAFEGNVNRLKAGKIITIPDRATVSAVDAEEASTTVRAQAADFDDYRKKLAATVGSAAPQKAVEPKRAASGKIQPKVEDKAPTPAPGKDKLEISKSEAASGKAGSGRIAAIEETLIAREKALKEANSRIAELEKNLQDLKKLVELKNQGMADLQKQAQPAATVAEAKQPATVPGGKKKAETAAKAPEPVQPPAQAQAPTPAPAPAPAPSVKKPLSPPPIQAAPSFIEQSPEIVYGGGAILALLLGYLAYSRRRKQRQADDQAATGATGYTSELAVSPAFKSSTSGGQQVDTNDLLAHTDFTSQSGMAASGGGAGVDPVAEANVYIAYGRDAQAEEILLDAHKSDPSRPAVQLKLLEIYVARNSAKQFEAIAADLHQQTGGVGSDWEAAAQLGRQVDPENPLYGPKTGAATAPPPDADMHLPASAEQGAGVASETLETLESLEDEDKGPTVEPDQAPIDMPQVHEDYTESLDFELDHPSASADAQKPVPEASQSDDALSESLDIELDFEVNTPPATAEPLSLPDVDAPQPQDDLSESLDLDLALDLDAEASESAAAEVASAAKSKKQPDTSDDTAHELDFDFDLGSAAPSPAPVPARAQPDDGNVIDFDLELPKPATQSATENLDLSSISLDFDEPIATPASSGTAQPAASNLDLSSISLDLDELSAPSPALNEVAMQEVATKLELALAYEEMGDKEGARELLQEVVNEGNPAQQQAARSKLAQLG